MGDYNTGKSGHKGGTEGWGVTETSCKTRFNPGLDKAKREKNDEAPEQSKLEK